MNADTPSNDEVFEEFQDEPWVRSIFRPVLISILATSAGAGVLAILRSSTTWQLDYVLPLIFLACLEGVYSTLQRGRPQWRDRRGIALRFGEIALLLVVLRLASWSFSTGFPRPDAIAGWLIHPGSFFDAQFIIVGITAVVAWLLAVGTMADFMELAIQADEYAAHGSHEIGADSNQERIFRAVSRSDVVGRFAWRWGWGGVVVVFCAAASRASVTMGGTGQLQMGISQARLPLDVLISLLGYFISGFLLISEGRLAVMRGRWYNQGVNVMPGVLQRWHTSSLLVILAIAMVAALLPLGSTSGLAVAMEFLLGLAIRAGYALLFVMIAVLSALLYPLRFLFRSSAGAESAPAPAQLDIPSQAEATSHLPPWLGGAVYWVVLALIVGYLLFSYLKAHGLLGFTWGGRWLQLRLWWRARWARVRRTAEAAGAALRTRLRTLRPRAPAFRGRVVHLNRMTPSARVRYFYISTLHRAAERGIERPPHKTPLEFGSDLTTQWPDAEVDFEQLTEAFLAARYDRHTIQPERAHDVQTVWRRVMRTLRQRKGGGQAEE